MSSELRNDVGHSTRQRFEKKCLQNYADYTQEDLEVWKFLVVRQNELVLGSASNAFQNGIKTLGIDHVKIADVKELGVRLKAISGWDLIGVGGLLSNADFFYLLNNKKFPVAVRMRSLKEVDFSELPDLFHDIYGHVSLLTNQRFCDYIFRYSQIAIKYLHNDLAMTYLGRLYWFTLETGLVLENGLLKPYGGAILSSSGEIKNVFSPKIPKYSFDLKQVMTTPYDNLCLQKEYFVIESFNQLFDCVGNAEEAMLGLLADSAE